jgi:outer membrane protein OmpA-like peptidoglycan-associated protein
MRVPNAKETIMSRVLLASAASLLLLAGCTDDTDYNTFPDTQASDYRAAWQMTRTDKEIDYEILDRVLFRTDSADLSEHAGDVVAALAEEARHHPGAAIVVDGYTDTTGTPEHNLDLSQARAKTVADALMQQGVNGRRIETHGYGETNLAVPTGDQVSEPRNRRVVVRLTTT